jgi:SpoVK/Ycf46/Vps4 family AAA+-type ATPase
MAWQDLVLPAGTLRQLEEIETYLHHRPTLLAAWGMAKRLRPGYRALFHGPPGTGKTLTAALLGAKLGLEVRRVDLSQTMSKYIGETEKNLAAVMDRAEQRQWLLVFDEADALFGKRSETRDAHDRYANQEIASLPIRSCWRDRGGGDALLVRDESESIDISLLGDLDLGFYLGLIGGLFGGSFSLRSIVLGLRAAQAALGLLFHLCLVLLRIVSHN